MIYYHLSALRLKVVGRTKLEIVLITELQYLLREMIDGWRINAEKFR